MKEKLEEILAYFEGTCEICLGNMGIEKYSREVRRWIKEAAAYDDEVHAMLYLVAGVIEYKQEQLEKAVLYWKEAERYAQSPNMKRYLAKIYSYYAICYYVKERHVEEHFYFQMATRMFEEQQLYSELALHYINILWYKRYDANTTETEEYMEQALKYARLSDSKINARVYLHIGYIQKTVFRDFAKGIKYLMMSNQLCRQNGFIEMESMTFHVLADGYMHLAHYEETIRIYEMILAEDRYQNITPNLKGAILSNMVLCYLYLSDFEQAERNILRLEKFVPLMLVNMREQFAAVARWLRAQLYIMQQIEHERAKALLHESGDIYSRYKKNFIIDGFDFKLCNHAGDLCMNQKDYAQAELTYLRLEELAEKYTSLERKEACGKLVKVYEALGDYQRALEYYQKEDCYFKEIEKANMLVQYEKLTKEFFQAIQEGILRDLNNKRRYLENNQYIDELTGLYNRAYYDSYQKTHELASDCCNMAVSLVDVDFFRQYNSDYGYEQGDDALKQIARIIQTEANRADGRAVRCDGERFAVLLENIQKKEALRVAERIVVAVREGVSTTPVLTVSVGAAYADEENAEAIGQLIEKAEKALQQAKQHGRNMAVLWGEA